MTVAMQQYDVLLLMCLVVLCRPVPPDNACRLRDKRRTYFSDTQELRRRRLPAAQCRQSHHVRLVDVSLDHP